MRHGVFHAVVRPVDGICTAMMGILYRDGTAIIGVIAVPLNSMPTSVYGTCTAMYRDLPHARAYAGAHVRTQERNGAQWDVSRYIAVHAVQNRCRSPRPMSRFFN
jgi:hypothetical protein